jgi:SAM-dependent methyltransferase
MHCTHPFTPPNRVLNLKELQHPSWRNLLRRMDQLLARDEISYLHPSKRWEYPWALEQAKLLPGNRVLDAGCGLSIFPVYLATIGMRITACDVELPVRLDRLHGCFVEYIRGDLTALPLADSTFDAIFCISVIEHLEEHRAFNAMGELRRVLRPGGRLLLTTDYYENSEAEIWHEGLADRFRVDWRVFDEAGLRHFLCRAVGFKLAGELELSVDWDQTRAAMRRFHGYPYTSVGISLIKD